MKNPSPIRRRTFRGKRPYKTKKANPTLSITITDEEYQACAYLANHDEISLAGVLMIHGLRPALDAIVDRYNKIKPR